MSGPKTYAETVQFDASVIGLYATQEMLALHIAAECTMLARRCMNAIEKENIDGTGYHIKSFEIGAQWRDGVLFLKSEMVLTEEMPFLEPTA